jgi:hypothetical protein
MGPPTCPRPRTKVGTARGRARGCVGNGRACASVWVLAATWTTDGVEAVGVCVAGQVWVRAHLGFTRTTSWCDPVGIDAWSEAEQPRSPPHSPALNRWSELARSRQTMVRSHQAKGSRTPGQGFAHTKPRVGAHQTMIRSHRAKGSRKPGVCEQRAPEPADGDGHTLDYQQGQGQAHGHTLDHQHGQGQAHGGTLDYQQGQGQAHGGTLDHQQGQGQAHGGTLDYQHGQGQAHGGTLDHQQGHGQAHGHALDYQQGRGQAHGGTQGGKGPAVGPTARYLSTGNSPSSPAAEPTDPGADFGVDVGTGDGDRRSEPAKNGRVDVAHR